MKTWIFLLSLVALNAVVACDDGPQLIEPDTKSKRGESCSATNDCDKGLVCMGLACVPDSYPIAKSAKTCYRIECTTTNDCCSRFNITDTDLCTQTYECRQESCEFVQTQCTDDTACGINFCVGGTCVACRTDTDCAETATCLNNSCVPRCTVDGNCGAFQSCVAGACQYTGCKTDRECIHESGNPMSKCVDTEEPNIKDCRLPCTSDAACPARQICDSNGACAPIGCDTDGDCRAEGTVPQAAGDTIVCR